jgi:hypothetical protein
MCGDTSNSRAAALTINLFARAAFTFIMTLVDPKSANHGKPKVISRRLKQTETSLVCLVSGRLCPRNQG